MYQFEVMMMMETFFLADYSEIFMGRLFVYYYISTWQNMLYDYTHLVRHSLQGASTTTKSSWFL